MSEEPDTCDCPRYFENQTDEVVFEDEDRIGHKCEKCGKAIISRKIDESQVIDLNDPDSTL